MLDSFKVSQPGCSVHKICNRAFLVAYLCHVSFSVIKSNEQCTLMLEYSNYICLQHVTSKLAHCQRDQFKTSCNARSFTKWVHVKDDRHINWRSDCATRTVYFITIKYQEHIENCYAKTDNVLIKFNFHGSMHRKNTLIYIQKDATLHSLFYLETALHVSDGTFTHHQESKQLYLQHLVFVRPLLLSAAIATGSSNGLTNNRRSHSKKDTQ
jgi:hypothetical protein